MRYHELIERYKNGELDGELKEQVEQDIERHEALSEYLFDREEENGLWDEPESVLAEDKKASGNDEFMKRINRAVRRAFIRMGAVVGAVLLAVILFVSLALPRIVDLFYYDPAKVVGRGEYSETNQMSLDMAVYTELKTPSDYRVGVQADEKGFGNYDVTIWQMISYTGRFAHLTGQVERGKLKLYDINYLQPVADNAFGWFQMDPDSGETLTEIVEKAKDEYLGVGGRRDEATQRLNDLEEGRYYQAYVTLDRIMDYADYIDLVSAFDDLGTVWCAPCVDGDGFWRTATSVWPVGFYTDSGVGYNMEWDEEAYPDLVLWGTGDDFKAKKKQLKEEEYAAEHFIVMLEYMAEQEPFLSMMGDSPEGYREAAEYIRENGLKVYGFACKAEKETLLELNEAQGVYSISADPLE